MARVDKVRTYLTGNGATAGQSATSTFTTFIVDHDWDAIDRRDKSAFTFSDQTGSATKEFRNDYTFDKLHRLTKVVQDVSTSDTSWVVDTARKRDVTFDDYVDSQLKKITRKQGTNTSGLITDDTQNGVDYDNQVPGRVSNVIHSGISGGSKIWSAPA